MGKAALEREFKKDPPREPLDSLAALWRDYARRAQNGWIDPCIAFTAKAPNLVTAIERACDSRGANGKMFNHQSKVTQLARDDYAAQLKQKINYRYLARKVETFEDIYKLCDKVGRRVEGIGPVTIYDVTCRLAEYMELEPESLYFHAGVAEGLKAMGVDLPRGKDFIPRDELPPFFRNKNLDMAESFLCGYRSEIERVCS